MVIPFVRVINCNCDRSSPHRFFNAVPSLVMQIKRKVKIDDLDDELITFADEMMSGSRLSIVRSRAVPDAEWSRILRFCSTAPSSIGRSAGGGWRGEDGRVFQYVLHGFARARARRRAE